MVVIFLLAVIVLLLLPRQVARDYTVGTMLLIVAGMWLSIKIHLLRILVDILALALEHWFETVMILSAGIVLIVPAVMMYIAMRDELDNRAVRREFLQSHGTVRTRFNQRVAGLMAQGYNRERAEEIASRLVKRAGDDVS